MSPKYEVEIRAFLAFEKKEEFIKNILNKNGVLKKEEYIIDEYFCPKEITRFEQIEMNQVGSYSLRLRKSEKNNESTFTLNTKVISKEGDHNAWKEFESEVQSYDDVREILGIMGFKKYFSLEKKRLTYSLEKFSILIENITDYGLVIEVEVMSNENESENAKSKIKDLLKDLEVNSNDIVPKTVTNILMKEKSIF